MNLAGTFGGDAERDISVRPGTAFSVPIWNLAWVTFPEDDLQEPDEIIAFMQDIFFDGAEEGTFSLEASLARRSAWPTIHYLCTRALPFQMLQT